MKHLWTRYIKPLVLWLLQGIIGAAMVLFFAYMLIEWASGCGETYTDSKGKVHINECVWQSEVPTKKGTN
jgi:hypothetical protein